mgnify:CR=1 FL=1|tara:strand:- start:97437 stop:98687 length:1251 start_codon:yes stop_codon:yes gene_type:complete
MNTPVTQPLAPSEATVKDLLRPEVIANPYPYYEQLRNSPPQFGLMDYPPGTIPGQDKPHPAWVFLRHQDVLEVVLNHEVFSSRDQMQEESSAPTLMLVNDDRPRHRFLRGIAQKAFMPKRVEQDVAPWAEQTVSEMVQRIGGGEVEFMDTYAVELPARFITRLIGTPQQDWPRLRNWSSAFMVTSDFTTEQRNDSNQEVARYYSDAVDARIAAIEQGEEVGDDLMSAFIQAEFEGQRLTREEIIRFCITLVVAGAETTVYFLGNLVATFLELPDLYQRLRADRSLVRPFIEESLRRDGPPQRLFRVATQDCKVGEVLVRKGDWVALFYAAANRDPAVFEKPDDFVLNRTNIARHLTFGHGIHSCMGSRIARMEADKLLNGLLDNFSSVEPGSSQPRRQTGGLLNYGLDSLPVVFRG